MDVIKRFIGSRKFWLAVFDMVQTLVFYLFPQLPKNIWESVHTLVLVLIGAFAVEDVALGIQKSLSDPAEK